MAQVHRRRIDRARQYATEEHEQRGDRNAARQLHEHELQRRIARAPARRPQRRTHADERARNERHRRGHGHAPQQQRGARRRPLTEPDRERRPEGRRSRQQECEGAHRGCDERARVQGTGAGVEQRTDEQQDRDPEDGKHHRRDVTPPRIARGGNFRGRDRGLDERLARGRTEHERVRARPVPGAFPSHAQRDRSKRGLERVVGRGDRRGRRGWGKHVLDCRRSHAALLGVDNGKHVDEPQAHRRADHEERRGSCQALGRADVGRTSHPGTRGASRVVDRGGDGIGARARLGEPPVHEIEQAPGAIRSRAEAERGVAIGCDTRRDSRQDRRHPVELPAHGLLDARRRGRIARTKPPELAAGANRGSSHREEQACREQPPPAHAAIAQPRREGRRHSVSRIPQRVQSIVDPCRIRPR
jgi:hypothetical protein